MRRLIEIATERRVTIAMFTVAIVLFGVVSLSRLKVNLLPDISYPTITIRTELTGGAPLEVENLITKPIEETVGIIKNVRLVRSVSRSGQSDVILEFLWGTDMDIAGVDVREKLDLLLLPLEAGRPMLLRFDPSNEPILRLALKDKQGDNAEQSSEGRLKSLRRLAEDRLKTDLEAVEGTAAVKVSGGLKDEIQVRVDQERLSQLGLSIDQVASRLRAENVNLSGGRLEQGNQRFLVRTINEFTSVEQMADSIVATVGDRPVYLRDIASVTQGYKEREAITRVDGKESVELAVYKEGDANTVQVADRLKGQLERVRKSLPENIELTTVYDQSTFISAAINQVTSAALGGGLLAIIVLFGFLRDARATLIIGLAIPVSVIGTFLLMYSSDVTLNIMSLGGIALAVGMLVDNSIVVLENIVRKREEGEDLLEAARSGTSEVAMAVTASTLTTVAVFFPMIFISGVAGELFKDQALTVSFALAFSLVVALTLIPMLAAMGSGQRYRDIPEDHAANSTPEELEAALQTPLTRLAKFRRGAASILRWIGAFFTRTIAFIIRIFRWVFAAISWVMGMLMVPPSAALRGLYNATASIYPAILGWSLKHRGIVLITATAAFVFTMSLVPRLGTELIPQLSQGEFTVDIRLPPGSPLAETDRSVLKVQERTSKLEQVAMAYSVAGTGNRLDASPVDSGEHTGSIAVTLKKGSDRSTEDQVMNAMRSEMRQLPGMQYEFSRPSLFSFSEPLQVQISGHDLDRLTQYSAQLVRAMSASDRFADIKSSIVEGNPEIQIVFDQERAAKLGIAVRDIANRVVANVRGELATRYTWRDKKIDVLVRSVDTQQASVEDIRNLIVNPASDRPVSLGAVADVVIARGPSEIRRVAQERVAIVTASVSYGDLGTAVTELQSLVAAIGPQQGLSANVAGQSEEMTQSFESMRFALALAVFLVYLVMASQFESLVHPFVILFTIPLALVGAVLGLFVTGTTVNVVALIGVIMLAGIVVNNAIVLVDMINQLQAKGIEKHEAIMNAGKARLRPIMMTTLTTVLGLLPMAIGFGEGAEVRTPMAITVIGGLLVSTVLTLVVIPVMYSLMDRKNWEKYSATQSVQLT